MAETVITIIHYENEKLTNECIDSIRKFTKSGSYHIVVVDNNSPTIYENNSDITVVRNDNRDNVSGINFGLYTALYKLSFQPKYVVVFDNDIICMENWLPPLVKTMEERPTVGIAGGKQWNKDMTAWRSVGADLLGMLYNNLPEEGMGVVWMMGSFHMYRAEMLRKIGLHDTRYQIICSDADFCLHAHDRGWEVRFIPDSNVIHICNASYKCVPVRSEQEDKQKLIQKWCGLKFNALLKEFPISFMERQWGEIKFIPSRKRRPAVKAISEYFKNKEVCGAEIGVRYGDNAETMLFYINGIKKLYLIDNNKDGCVSFMEDRFRAIDKVELIKKSSLEAAKDIKDNSLDFVYIDADHSYKSVTEDIGAWLPKVKKGGIVSGHDYTKPTMECIGNTIIEDFEVIEAVDDFFGKENITTKETDWWVFI
jgi:hypothetical protein